MAKEKTEQQKQQQPTRGAAKKIKDKWRAKQWFKILAPAMFEGVQIGETLADDPSKLVGRELEVTLQDLTGDFSKMHVKLLFQITEIRGDTAHTKLIGHDLTSDYIRRQTRRKRSKMDTVVDVTTKDGFGIRVKPMATTEKRIQTSKQKALCEIINQELQKSAKENTIGEFVKTMVSSNLSTAILKVCKQVYPLKKLEIRKSEIYFEPEPSAIEDVQAEKPTEPAQVSGVPQPSATPEVPQPLQPAPEVPQPLQPAPELQKTQVSQSTPQPTLKSTQPQTPSGRVTENTGKKPELEKLSANILKVPKTAEPKLKKSRKRNLHLKALILPQNSRKRSK